MPQGNENIRIRKVDPDGAEAGKFREHLHKLGDGFYDGPPRTRFPLPEGSVVLVAELPASGSSSDQPAIQTGSVAIKPLKASEPIAKGLSEGVRFAEIKRMVVLPEYQGTGVAQQLLSAIEQVGKTELGAQCIVLETLHSLVPARRFYEKCGYQKRVVYGIYHPEHSQCYEKWL